jgi:hypothetical protein
MIGSAFIRAVSGALCVWIAVCLHGCGYSHEEQIDGPYYLAAIDAPDLMRVYYRVSEHGYVGRIPETVFAVGWNSKYIVAKVHPSKVRSLMDYYYLIRELDGEYKDAEISVRGPLAQQDFNRMKAEIGLPDFSRSLE